MVSEKIKELRKNAKMSQEALADKLNVSRQAVTKWETGAGVPDIDNLMAIAKLFQVSLDELVGNVVNGSADRGSCLFESVTEYDIDRKKNFDITFMGAKSVAMRAYEGEKVKVTLASNQIPDIQKAFKTKIDDLSRKIDINVKRLNAVSETQAKANLMIDIALPLSYIGDVELEGNVESLEISGIASENVEFSGKVRRILCAGLEGHLEIDTNADAEIQVTSSVGRIDVNQISATSRMYLPAAAEFATVTKGIANHILMADEFPNVKKPAEEPALIIELNGMKSELTISADTRPEHNNKGAVAKR